mmetsp:Transcript_109178/g.216776  ORF Transcript_109178/g.216776 Transcript_109178/m.216776 type:complete len:80 (-) Transcript_109178:4-243(-)
MRPSPWQAGHSPALVLSWELRRLNQAKPAVHHIGSLGSRRIVARKLEQQRTTWLEKDVPTERCPGHCHLKQSLTEGLQH